MKFRECQGERDEQDTEKSKGGLRDDENKGIGGSEMGGGICGQEVLFASSLFGSSFGIV